MRVFVLSLLLLLAVLFRKVGSGQVYQLPTPPPQVTAGNTTCPRWAAAR